MIAEKPNYWEILKLCKREVEFACENWKKMWIDIQRSHDIAIWVFIGINSGHVVDEECI